MKDHHRTRNPSEMDKALEECPPQIVWRNDKGGIKRAVSVQDPHAEGPQWKRDREPEPRYLEYLDIVEEVKASECTDENLLNAARTDI
jgi:hypothetical protein